MVNDGLQIPPFPECHDRVGTVNNKVTEKRPPPQSPKNMIKANINNGTVGSMAPPPPLAKRKRVASTLKKNKKAQKNKDVERNESKEDNDGSTNRKKMDFRQKQRQNITAMEDKIAKLEAENSGFMAQTHDLSEENTELKQQREVLRQFLAQAILNWYPGSRQ